MMFVVIRTITFLDRSAVSSPVEAFAEQADAEKKCRDLDMALQCTMECALVPREGQSEAFKNMTGQTFLVSLGVQFVEHGIVDVPVKDRSLIAVPKINILAS